tara:strand:+ start:113 stop:352 length:240 start_codon:yes stop_codon:yes gene_type:complete
MKNYEKLINCFTESLKISEDLVNDNLKYQSIPQWDSIAHMALVAQVESQFDIMLDTEEILDMSSVSEIKKILTKHDIKF